MKTLRAACLASGIGIALAVLERVLDAAAREREALRVTTLKLKHRNDQLTALYNVFSKITETLSLRYVVNSTLREANNLMKADMTVLRVLRGDELIVIGAMSGSGQEISHIPTVRLGDGPTGRAARQGRVVKLETDAEQTMGPPVDNGLSPSNQTGEPPLESGMVVPLIVGARVVGTLSCWSRRQYAFDNEDERILEMMASQVATAVAAADAMDLRERQAHHDALTDLPNRHQLNEDLDGDLGELARIGRRAVVAMVDVDNFKLLNDDFGHRVGDITLQKVASVMRTAVRDNDRLYRYGGEEFVVVFMDVDSKQAAALAERLRKAVESTPHSGDQLQPVGPVTISIGLAAMPDHAADIGSLIELADAAMYQAKQNGRNCTVVWRAGSSRVA